MSAETSDETFEFGGRETVELDDRPTIVSSAIAVTAGVLAMAGSAPYSALAIPFGLLGLVFLAAGLFVKGSRSLVSLGVMSFFIAILIVGALGLAPPTMLLASIVGTIIAWDVAQYGITIGEQMGRNAPTKRGELFHAGGSTVVGVLAAGVGYGVFRVGSAGQPALALLLLFLGATVMIWALRD